VIAKFKDDPGGKNICVPGNTLYPARSFSDVKSAGADPPAEPEAKAIHPMNDPVID
jgi:hypothetical protein